MKLLRYHLKRFFEHDTIFYHLLKIIKNLINAALQFQKKIVKGHYTNFNLFQYILIYISYYLVFDFWFIRKLGIQNRFLMSSIDQMNQIMNILELGIMATLFWVYRRNQRLHIKVLSTCLDALVYHSLPTRICV